MAVVPASPFPTADVARHLANTTNQVQCPASAIAAAHANSHSVKTDDVSAWHTAAGHRQPHAVKGAASSHDL